MTSVFKKPYCYYKVLYSRKWAIYLFICSVMIFETVHIAKGNFGLQSDFEPLGTTPKYKFSKPLVDNYDAGDYYLMEDGQKVPLLRAKTELAVKFKEEAPSIQNLQRLQQMQPTFSFERTNQIYFRTKGRTDILNILPGDSNQGLTLETKSVAASTFVEYAYYVFIDPVSKCRMIPTDEVIVRLDDEVSLEDVLSDVSSAGLEVAERTGTLRMKIYLLRLSNPKITDPLDASRTLAASDGILWAVPNFIREIQRNYTPNDPIFSKQQYLNNTGQNGGLSDADVDAPQAWDQQTGDPSIVIAIIDDGVDTSHKDLNIEPGGWDFADGDNDPNPVGDNGHGTGCAGVAAAIGNNAYHVAGMAYGCKILPIKIVNDSGIYTSDNIIGNAISYAADRADVLSNSWGGGSPSPYINDAINDAITNGRGSKGCPVFFATGNYASTWNYGGSRIRLSIKQLNIGSGEYRFAFYYKRGGNPNGKETVKIDDVCLLDSDGYTQKNSVLSRQNFEGTFPPNGWSLGHFNGASSDWYKSSENAKTGTGGSYSATTPSISNGQYVFLYTPLLSISGNETLAFDLSISMSESSIFGVAVYDSGGVYITDQGLYGYVPEIISSVSYPASYTNTIAVGASTDCDLRSDYSQFGTGLDFVAPSNGGWNDIATLDPTGEAGSTDTDYKMSFGGTSSACPLATGVAALMLSKNPNLTAAQVRTIMQNTCDKIGGFSSVSTYYGHGRINARAAVDAVPLPQEDYIDIGLRYYDGTQTVSIACEQGTPTSPLRISKNGTTYGIALVDSGDSHASGIIIQTSSGPKAIRKL